MDSSHTDQQHRGSGSLSGTRSAVATPLPVCEDARVLDAWHHWLEALGEDAEAALATSLAYKQLDDRGRDRWLDALADDSAKLCVPRIAVYAPLLAVETDAQRRARIRSQMGPADVSASPRGPLRALRGTDVRGGFVAAITLPLYLDFVEVLACGYHPTTGIDWVRHDPIVASGCIPRAGDVIEGARLEKASMPALIDELAHAVVAHTRGGRTLPDALRKFAHLFAASGSSPSERPE